MSKVAVVTGGIGGLGTAMCKALIEQGRRAVAVDFHGLKPEAVDKWKADRKAEGLDIPVYLGDVTSFESCAEVCKKIEAEVGPIEILVNNAGITRDALFHKMTPEQWDAVIKTNLYSLFNMTKQVYEGMTARGWGRIVNIASVNGLRGQAGQTNYSATKAAVYGFCKALAQECVKRGVTVNSISPGYIGTEMVRAIREDVLQKVVAGIPAARLGEPSEIARTVAFLTADDAGYITGEDITVNGGLYYH
ncbi:MAG: acetoacetyl-CoA reductase [Candidatus Contendobacter sp.]|nr:acetoacetyl-CoA reductase [Candidatus Contendobacter sp.]MDG4557866.1 acetoacetyl-CoA reductase [Candidatus Contendobacter sp.]